VVGGPGTLIGETALMTEGPKRGATREKAREPSSVVRNHTGSCALKMLEGISGWRCGLGLTALRCGVEETATAEFSPKRGAAQTWPAKPRRAKGGEARWLTVTSFKK